MMIRTESILRNQVLAGVWPHAWFKKIPLQYAMIPWKPEFNYSVEVASYYIVDLAELYGIMYCKLSYLKMYSIL